MKLQLNNSGAWKNLVSFYTQDMADVMLNARRLFEAGERADGMGKTTLRILDDCDSVAYYWDAQRGWWQPKARV